MSLLVLLGGTLAVNAAPGSGSSAAQPEQPPTTPPLQVSSVDPCQPEIGQICHTTNPPAPRPSTQLPVPTGSLPPCDTTIPMPCQPTDTPTGAPTGAPTSTTPCTGEGCIPDPTTSAPPTGGGPGGGPEEGDGEEDCGLSNIGGCITNAINAFFRGLVTAALNPLLDLLSNTLLTTPMPNSLPRIGELWNNSWQILLACYVLLVLLAGLLVMSYETLQTRHSIKEIAPRIVVGLLAGALSLWVATKGIQITNGLAQAVMGGGVDASQPMAGPGTALKDMILGSLTGGIWIIFMGIFLAGMLVVLLVTYIVRVALTLVLIAGAPLALMFHALPQTEGIARWWWKAFGGCLAIQVIQSLALITAMRVFFAPGGFTMFGPTVSGLVNLLVAIALMFILFKIPFWVLGSLRGGAGRSLIGSLARGFLAYKAFGLLSGRGSHGKGRASQPSGYGGQSGGGRGHVDPYGRTRATTDGQYLLPLTGVRRTRRAATPRPAARTSRAARGRQLALPLGDDWPENKPILGRDGQYRLPLDVHRVKPVLPPPGQAGSSTPSRGEQQPLPLDGPRRTPRPASPPPPAARPRMRATQLELPFDPYKGNRATRSGQYPLPLEGLRRVAPTKPTPTKPAPATPASAARPGPRAGRQLRLPLDLPKPARRTPPPKSGGKS